MHHPSTTALFTTVSGVVGGVSKANCLIRYDFRKCPSLQRFRSFPVSELDADSKYSKSIAIAVIPNRLDFVFQFGYLRINTDIFILRLNLKVNNIFVFVNL